MARRNRSGRKWRIGVGYLRGLDGSLVEVDEIKFGDLGDVCGEAALESPANEVRR
jgi:hypothetical protein